VVCAEGLDPCCESPFRPRLKWQEKNAPFWDLEAINFPGLPGPAFQVSSVQVVPPQDLGKPRLHD
jgi:hypothetical protein